VSAGWTAGAVRARALTARRLGPGRARTLAVSSSLSEALELLAATPYGRNVRPGQDLREAQCAVAATFLWHLRVLAGWLPRGGVRLPRAAAGWFEIVNVDQALRGGPMIFDLGALAVAKPSSNGDVRQRLAVSPWGDPGDDDPGSIRWAMRATWAERIARADARARPWASGAVAVAVAAEHFHMGRRLPKRARSIAAHLLGTAAMDAGSLEAMQRRLGPDSRWTLKGVTEPGQLWRAEARCWARIERDGLALLRGSAIGTEPVLGAIAVLGVDAWRVRAALEATAGGARGVEVYDALA
jgi:hypothetical protein